MLLYPISVFLHVVGALGLFSALALEWAGHEPPRRVSGLSALFILSTGVYMTAARWGPRPWIVVGLVGMVIIAILGPVLGRRVGAAALSRRLRTSLFLGIVFLMTTEPGLVGSLAAMGVALLLGVVASVPLLGGSRRPAQVARSER